MVLKYVLYITFLCSTGAHAKISLESGVAARINGNPILTSTVKRLQSQLKLSYSEALERSIEFQLAVEEAKRQRVHELPQVKNEIDKILYKAFLKRQKLAKQTQLSPSKKQIKSYYDKFPMIRLRHLVLFARTPEEKERAEKRSTLINLKLTRGVPFKKLVLQYSEDGNLKTAGDLDFRGFNKIPKKFLGVAKSLKKGEVSKPFFYQNSVHWLQLIERRPYNAASATYISLLRSKVQSQLEQNLLRSTLMDLRKKAKIEVTKPNKQS